MKRQIREVARRKGITAALEEANRLLGGFGVEVVWGKRQRGYGWPDIEYVNMGDAYAPTVMYDYTTDRFLWCTSWGDIVERRGYEE